MPQCTIKCYQYKESLRFHCKWLLLTYRDVVALLMLLLMCLGPRVFLIFFIVPLSVFTTLTSKRFPSEKFIALGQANWIVGVSWVFTTYPNQCLTFFLSRNFRNNKLGSNCQLNEKLYYWQVSYSSFRTVYQNHKGQIKSKSYIIWSRNGESFSISKIYKNLTTISIWSFYNVFDISSVLHDLHCLL